jgi:hypothetical protein
MITASARSRANAFGAMSGCSARNVRIREAGTPARVAADALSSAVRSGASRRVGTEGHYARKRKGRVLQVWTSARGYGTPLVAILSVLV